VIPKPVDPIVGRHRVGLTGEDSDPISMQDVHEILMKNILG